MPPNPGDPVGVGPDGVDRRGTVEIGRMQLWLRTRVRERRLGRYLERATEGVAEILHHRVVGTDDATVLEHVAIAPSGVWLVSVLRAPHASDDATDDQLRSIVTVEQQRLEGVVATFRAPDLVHDALAAVGFDWVSVRPFVCVEDRQVTLTVGDGIARGSRRRLAKRLLGPGQLRPRDIQTLATTLNERLPIVDLGPSRH